MSKQPIEKQTFIDADAKTTKALTFDMLEYQCDLLEKLQQCHEDHMAACNKRFEKLEAKRKRDTATSAVSGFLGGFVAMAVYWFKNWLK